MIVFGYIVRFPLAGMSWHYLQYVLGLRDLGIEVFYLEDSDDYEQCCYNPITHENGTDASFGLAYADRLFRSVGLGDCWAYYDAHEDTWSGPVAEGARDILESADVVINVSGSNPVRDWAQVVPKRVLIDTDPGFEQIRQLTVPHRRELGRRHTDFFSFGENIDKGTAEVPDDGIAWKATRQPVVLRLWEATEAKEGSWFSTVMQWDSYPCREYGGRMFGMKSKSFEDYWELPKVCEGVELCLALAGSEVPREKLRQHGWHLLDATQVTRESEDYRALIQQSLGEFTVAKHGYVVGRSGWFSERSCCYLASGRPVITQETGFSEWMETGTGVVPFEDFDSARAAVADVVERYEVHAEAARSVAEKYFDAEDVLESLLNRLD